MTKSNSNDADFPNSVAEIIKSITAAKGIPKPKPKRTPAFAYRPALVSYFDVLGMRDLMTAAAGDPGKVGTILKVTGEFSKPDKGASSNFDWSSTNFSDLVLRTVPILSKGNKRVRLGLVFHELFDLAYIQTNLAAKGIVVRGAVTIGGICKQSGLVFGPALVDAYLLESKVASYPRIIIDRKVFAALKQVPLLRKHDNYNEELTYISGLAKKDADGLWFVDYLRYVAENADDDGQYVDFLKTHKRLCEKQLAEARSIDGRSREGRSRRSKAAWLQRYHNAHVSAVDEIWLTSAAGIQPKDLIV